MLAVCLLVAHASHLVTSPDVFVADCFPSQRYTDEKPPVQGKAVVETVC